LCRSNIDKHFIQDDFVITLNNANLRRVNAIKFVGLSFTDSLSFEPQTNDVCNKLSSSCALICRLRDNFNLNALLMVYYAHVQSHLSYGCIFWGTDKSANRVFILQKRIIRVIAKVPYTQHCKPFFIKFGILTFPCLLVIEACCFVLSHKELFSFNNDFHNYQTRSSSAIVTNKTNFRIAKFNPLCICRKSYNWALPVINKYKSNSLIKKILVFHLKQLPCCSIDEVFDINTNSW